MLSPKVLAFKEPLEETINARLGAIENDSLRKAMAHALQAGGKRLRPLMLLAVVETFGGDIEQALPAAASLEYAHTYSLIHDDLPAMDNDTLRRGQPTVHVAFGEDLAILAGDALQAESFALVSHTEAEPEVVVSLTQLLAQAIGANGMVAGQVLDIASTGQTLSVADLRFLQGLKTGALIEAAALMGGALAGVGEKDTIALRKFAQSFGLAFQIQDDINDVEKTAEEIGKTPHKDEAVDKPTYVALLGLEGAKNALAQQLMVAREGLYQLSVESEALASFLSYFDEQETI